MNQLLREFLAEAEDLIEALFRDIQLLREQHADGRARRELTGRIFRHVHTLKGTAAAAGLSVASQIAHELETLLDGIRLGRSIIGEPVLDAFDHAAHALAQALQAAARGETYGLPLQLIENLRRLAESDEQTPASPSSATAEPARLPEEVARTLGADEQQRVREAVTEGQRLFFVNVTFDLETFDSRFRELTGALAHSAELISTLPGVTEAAPGSLSFRLLYASRSTAEELSALASNVAPAVVAELQPEAASRSEGSAAKREAELTLDTVSAERIVPLATQVRVELGQLDDLVASAHELLTETIATFNLALGETVPTDVRRRVEAGAEGVRRRFLELEEQLIGLRRVPLARTLERVARAGRLAARTMGKDVAFETAGGEVRLDKSLVEAISDPLLHLVRNAIDHGIESTAERAGAGKEARARVRLEAATAGDRVILKVTDDGRGIDLERITRAAVEHNLMEAGRSVTKEQALRLIFRPGFSTAVEVSRMSGRGVGLDVVERAVEQIGGEMRVRSQTGRGTTFEMIVPVALALSSALVVSSDGFSYCVDAGLIKEVCRIKAEDVEQAGGLEFVRWREARLPLVRLRGLLGQPGPQTDGAESWPIVIVAPAKRAVEKASGEDEAERVALLVDACEERRAEVLVRRLGAHGVRWFGVTGAAELSDGALALVLDLPRLLESHFGER
jgi:two-component system chemotaxis sensor kinase CheA